MIRTLRILIVIGLLAGTLAACQHWRLSSAPTLPTPPANGIRIASWNVHYILLNEAQGRWGMAGWEARKGPLDTTFKVLDADLVAFQEMESFAGGDNDEVNLARSWLLDNNADYRAAAIGPWQTYPSTQPMLYRHSRLQPVDQGWFFFSETPEVIYSRSFDGRYPAFASWVQFQDRANGATFRVVNVHFDAGSRLNRRRSAALVAERIAPWIDAGDAVMLVGDINARHGSGLHRQLTAAGLVFARIPGATYHFGRGWHLFGAIDHLGTSVGVELVQGPWVFNRRLGDTWPSDHHPVVADIRVDPTHRAAD